MKKIISFLLFIWSAPKFLFLGEKMDSPMNRIEGVVAVFLSLLFSFIPNVAFLLLLESKETFYKLCFISLGITLPFFVWNVFSVNENIVRAYFSAFNKMSKIKAICLFFMAFIMQFFLILFPIIVAKSILK